MKKRLCAILLTIAMILALVACGTSTPAPTEAPKAEEPKVEAHKEESPVDAPAEQESWKPEKDVTFVVGFNAGGTADIPARVMAKYMSKYSGVNVVVTNITGSSGQVAAMQVMETAPDGYTLLHIPVGYYLQAALGNADFTYEDFSPITMWCDSWVGLVVRADSPYETYEDLVAAVKESPNTIMMGSVSGTLPQLAALAIQQKEGIEFKMVDLGSNNKATELLGGRIDVYIDGVGQVKQYVESGDFRVLMAFAQDGTEVPGFEGLTTAGALGYSDFDYLLQSFGMWMPAGADTAVVQYWADIIKACSEDPECIAELNALGYGARHEEPADYAEICKAVQEGTNNAIANIVG